MRDLLKELLDLLQLESLKTDVYLGQSQDLGWGRVFGGQVIAQSMTAANNTVDKPRVLHSLHGYFLRPGDTHFPIEYRVERMRDGGTFSFRRVVAHQQDQAIFVMSASFQVPEEGFEHQFEMPKVAGPENLPSELELRRKRSHMVPEKIRQVFISDRPFEVRPVDPVDPFKPEKKSPYSYSWVRPVGQLPTDPMLNKCLLAYISDWDLVNTCLLPHGATTFSNRMQIASLDHAMWFHHSFTMEDWILYAHDSPSASSGRGLNRGNFFTRNGKLISSVTQESLIRIKKS